MKKNILLLLFLFAAITLNAQDLDYAAETIISPQYFIAVIAGVILAMGFQFILTALSIASGITAIGDVREKYIKSKYHFGDKDHFDDDDDEKNSDKNGMSVGTMITTGFGIWSVVTVTISLFAATALALELALISSTSISITLGLVIWALFFILLFYLESKMVNSLIGNLINTATAGLRASGEAVKRMFTSSPETKLKNIAESTVDKVRKDFESAYDPKKFNDVIDRFFNRMDKAVPDYEKVKKDIEDIVNESAKFHAEEDAKHSKSSGSSPAKWMAVQSVLTNAISQSESSGDRSKTEKLKQLSEELKRAYDSGNTAEEKVEKVVAKLTPMEEEQVAAYIQKLKDFLSTASPGDMEPENLKNKINHLLDNPDEAKKAIVQKVGGLDKDSIVNVLADNTSLSKDQLNNYADKISGVLDDLKNKFGRNSSSDPYTERDKNLPVPGDFKTQIETLITDFLKGSSRTSTDFSILKNHFMDSLHGSGDNLSDIKRSLKRTDKDTILSWLKNHTMVEQEHIDSVMNSFEEAKTSVLDKVQRIEDEATKKIENLKRKAVIEAENTRKNAAAAAWWVVASSVVSAVAAILGSLVAM
ncbi:MAG TPA: hypothetical protein VFM70_06200 [Salinimicrobium sp.]|nr:hypothetical protein [Salinimicrobium sp.]